jgi:hypothetical protein
MIDAICKGHPATSAAVRTMNRDLLMHVTELCHIAICLQVLAFYFDGFAQK